MGSFHVMVEGGVDMTSELVKALEGDEFRGKSPGELVLEIVALRSCLNQTKEDLRLEESAHQIHFDESQDYESRIRQLRAELKAHGGMIPTRQVVDALDRVLDDWHKGAPDKSLLFATYTCGCEPCQDQFRQQEKGAQKHSCRGR